MAQLPPKVPPSMTQNWPSFPLQMTMPIPVSAVAPQQTSWVDEFFDFSSVRRSNHRRSVSDPIAFVEAPFNIEECSNGNKTNGFEGLDDEQLRSMFSDDAMETARSTKSSSNPSSTNPSTPSDQYMDSDEKHMPPDQKQTQQPKNEPVEVEPTPIPCKSQSQEPANAKPSTNVSGDAILDPKRVKRILANRQSARRSRVRKLQYISELERCVTTLQTEVSALSPRVAFLDHQRLILNVDNSALKQRIAALAQDKIFKDAHQEALKKEIERLRQIYHEQNMKKMASEDAGAPPPPHSFNKMCGTDD